MNSSQEERVDTHTEMYDRAVRAAASPPRDPAAAYADLLRALIERWPPTWAFDPTNPDAIASGLIRAARQNADKVASEMREAADASTGWVPSTKVREWARAILEDRDPPAAPVVIVYGDADPPEGIEVWAMGEAVVILSDHEGTAPVLAEVTGMEDMPTSREAWEETVAELLDRRREGRAV